MGVEIMVWKIDRQNYSVAEVFQSSSFASLDEATRSLPGGGYTTLRTYNGKQVLLLSDHFTRLQETSLLSGRTIDFQWAQVREALRTIVGKFQGKEKRIRIIVDLQVEPGTLFVLAEPLTMPSVKDYETGVKIVSRKIHRENPKAKLTSFIDKAAQVRKSLPGGINEAIMIAENGDVLEGLSSNFFGIKKGKIWTAENGVLHGITRTIVLKVIGELGIPLEKKAVLENQLSSLDEVFITSASRSVLPVSEIDGALVGNGRPGTITKLISKRFQETLITYLEYI